MRKQKKKKKGWRIITNNVTSTKSRRERNLLMYLLMLSTVLNNCGISWLFIIRSRYRWRKRVSWSLRRYLSGCLRCPGDQISCFLLLAGLGNMWRQGDSTVKDRGKILNSPLLVFPGEPVTPTISPRLAKAWSFANSALSSSDFLKSAMTWTFKQLSFKS